MLALMTAAASCPDENALVRFSTGKLTGTDLTGLETHLDGCGPCRKLVARLAALKPASAPMTDAIGPTLARHAKIGRYQVEGLLGGGGMGIVYAARDRELNRAVALKLLRTTTQATPELRARLQREAQTMAKLSHPNLVPVFELGADGDDHFLVMELIDGPTLDVWLREKKPGWKEVLRLFVEAGRGLEAAHTAGVVHRDFKPGNVLIGPDGRARVTDFGLSRPDLTVAANPTGGPLELTRAGTLLGTPAYMAPEQLTGKVADARSDQFSFCVALAEALTGTRPYTGETIEALRARMFEGRPALEAIEPLTLQRTIARGLSLFPENRFASMGALLAELSALLRPPIHWKRVGVIAALALAVAAGPLLWKKLQVPVYPMRLPTSAQLIRLRPQNRMVLSIEGLYDVRVADPKVASAVLIDPNTLAVTAIAPGTTSVQAFQDDYRPGHELAVQLTVVVEPSDISSDDGSRPIVLTPQAQLLLTIPQHRDFTVTDDRIVRVKTLGEDQVLLTGGRVGVATVVVSGQDGKPLEYAVRVDAQLEPIRLTPGSQKTIDVTEASELRFDREDFVEVKRDGEHLTLTARKLGTTKVEVLTASGSRAKYQIEVVAPGPYREGNLVHTFPGAFFKTHLLDVVDVETGTDAIATARLEPHDMVRIEAHGKGRTILRAWGPSGEKLAEWEVVVGDPPKP